MDLSGTPELYEKIIWQDDVKQNQIRLVVNTFREVEYLSIRKYYLSFEEEWEPSPQGITFPIDIDNSRSLLIGLAEILSLAETREIIEEYFGDIIREIYNNNS
jgi:hypothetical protein